MPSYALLKLPFALVCAGLPAGLAACADAPQNRVEPTAVVADSTSPGTTAEHGVLHLPGAGLVNAAVEDLRAMKDRDSASVRDAARSAERVELSRDERGVPHVYAPSLAGAFYGLGLASAQDRLFQMHYFRATMRGELAAYFAATVDEGSEEAASTEAFNNQLVANDRKMRTYSYAYFADRTVEQLPADIQASLQGFARGVNAHLHEVNGELGGAFEDFELERVPMWTAADSLLVWEYMGALFPGIGVQNEIKQLLDCEDGGCDPAPCDRPIDESAALVPRPEPLQWPPQIAAQHAFLSADQVDLSLKASHGWAVAGARMDTGKPALFMDPQIAVTAPAFWYEFHLHTDDTNVRGMTLAGAPGAAIFFNEFVGHTATAAKGDAADLFELVPGAQNNTYVVDGLTHPLEVDEQLIAVRGQADRAHTVRRSRYGPVVNPQLNNVPAGRLFAMRHIEHLDLSDHSIMAGMRVMEATDLTSYRDALNDWKTPGANLVYAGVDAGDPTGAGHIAYHYGLGIPDRARIVRDGLDLSGQIPLDGSDSSNDWQGILDLDWRPHVIDPEEGYILSANHLPVGEWYRDFVPVGYLGNGDTFRSYRLRRIFEELLGEQGSTMTFAQGHAMHIDATASSVEIYRQMLMRLRSHGRLSIPPNLNFVAEGPFQKAGKVLAALNLWARNGGEAKWSDPYYPLVRRVQGALGTQSRYGVNPEFACAYHESQAGAVQMMKRYLEDPDAVVLTPPVAVFLFDVAVEAWDEARKTTRPNPYHWVAPDPVPDFTVKYQNTFRCLVPDGGDHCSLRPEHAIQIGLDRSFGGSIASSQSASGPGSIDFSHVDNSFFAVPPGASEDPASASFAAALDVLRKRGEGDVDFLPPAPLSQDAVEPTLRSTKVLRFVH